MTPRPPLTEEQSKAAKAYYSRLAIADQFSAHYSGAMARTQLDRGNLVAAVYFQERAADEHRDMSVNLNRAIRL